MGGLPCGVPALPFLLINISSNILRPCIPKEPTVAHHPTHSVPPKLEGRKRAGVWAWKSKYHPKIWSFLFYFWCKWFEGSGWSPADGSSTLMPHWPMWQRCRSWWNDWHGHDMLPAALSPTPRAGDNHCSLWRGVKEEMLHFYWTSKRTVVSKVVIFSCVWVAAGCGLSHRGPAVNAKRCDGPCLWTQTREEDVQPWGPVCPVVAHSQPPPELPTAVTKIPDPAMQTVWSPLLTCIGFFFSINPDKSTTSAAMQVGVHHERNMFWCNI